MNRGNEHGDSGFSLPCYHSLHYLVPSFTEYLWQLVETLNWSVTLSAFGGRYFYFSSSWKKLLLEPKWFEVTKTRQFYWQHDKEHSKNINECFGSRQTLLWNRKNTPLAQALASFWCMVVYYFSISGTRMFRVY